MDKEANYRMANNNSASSSIERKRKTEIERERERERDREARYPSHKENRAPVSYSIYCLIGSE